MFPAESKWGTFMRMGTNSKHASSNMMLSMVDKEHVSFFIDQVRGPLRDRFTSEALQMLSHPDDDEDDDDDSVWGEEELLKSDQLHISFKGAEAVGKLSPHQCEQLLFCYCRA